MMMPILPILLHVLQNQDPARITAAGVKSFATLLHRKSHLHPTTNISKEKNQTHHLNSVETNTISKRWFAVNMGTGIVSILLFNLPWNGYWLHIISYIFFALNILLFTIFCIISLLRYTLYPEIWMAMISHPAQSLFLGCFPMGFASTSPPISFHLNTNKPTNQLSPQPSST